MILVMVINIATIVAGCVLPNEFLAENSFWLYGIQFFTLIPYLLGSAREVKNLFIPTFFVLVYYLVNLTMGSWLVPRDYGWDKRFTETVLAVDYYNVIVPFLLSANLVLFLLTRSTLCRLSKVDQSQQAAEIRDSSRHPEWFSLMKSLLYFSAFALLTTLDAFNAFSFQLAIMVMHLTEPSLRHRLYRFLVYGGYMLLLLAFSFENKREIAMSLFLFIFIEGYFSRAKLTFGPAKLVGYVGAGILFFGLVLAASILRGYGDFQVKSALQAVTLIPNYISSDLFIDGITDNLELNYCYGTTITAMDHGLRGLVDFQYGASLFKWIFLPIPRDALDYKPMSMMQLFTAEFLPDWWREGGSLPVMFAADMFLNFHVFGIVAFALVWRVLNELFVKLHTVTFRSLAFFSCIFLVITVLMFARGSGLELWLMYYLFGLPLLLAGRLAGNWARSGSEPRRLWVV
jgi:hypothetical protein